ncbi:MAG: sigma-70 family RNA polymerase sigma factor [Vicinamibacterales bacterium]
MTTLAPATIDGLFRTADAQRWDLSREEFATAVNASVQRAFPHAKPSHRELDRYLNALHAADLALASACALGREAAWNHFILTHRPLLYRSADALDPGGGARELADALYADLYGISAAAVDRRSLFRYFHGRSSLGTWLRAVLAQRHVDAIRARRRLDPLPAADTATIGVAAPPGDPDRPRLVRLVIEALTVAIDRLAPRDRLRLRSYYVLQLTLSQIGVITGEHEATVSRHLSRTRRALREGLEQHLGQSRRLTAAEVGRAVELALEDPGGLDLHHAFDGSSDRKNSSPERSESET